MAKKIKFALKMKDGAEVRDIESLREHFDADTVVGYFLDGRLLTWLGNFYYDTEADSVEKLDKNDGQLKKKLCEIFNVEYENDGEFDVELAAKRREKLEKLKQYTADEKILSLVDNVAFDRDDMVELLDEDADTIVLVDGAYRIPLREHGKKYIGVGNVVAEINSKEVVDFDEIGIKFENIRFDDEYAALLNVNPVEDFRRLYGEAKEADDREKMFKYALKCAESGEADMMIVVGDMYLDGDGVNLDEEEGAVWYKRAVEAGDTSGEAYCGLGLLSNNEWDKFWNCKQSAEAGFSLGMYVLGHCYLNGEGTNPNENKGVYWLRKAANAGCIYAMEDLGGYYQDHKQYDQAFQYFNMGAERDDEGCLLNLGLLYESGKGVTEDKAKAEKLYKKAGEKGSVVGAYAYAFRLYRNGNYGEAFQWVIKALKLNPDFVMAQFLLGRMYCEGKGVNQDIKTGEDWLRQAADNGSEEAEKMLEELEAAKNNATGVNLSTSTSSSGCFITTAVCGTFNKPDDCYELTSFRNFRDNWLINQPDGASLVQEYYRIAPGIVERINALADAKNIYMSIWQEYLKPCLSCIEDGNMQKCKEIYVDMVRNLQKNF